MALHPEAAPIGMVLSPIPKRLETLILKKTAAII
jgi:hypothetical protein